MVAFQWRRVWKWIWFRRGLLSFWAILFLWCPSPVLRVLGFMSPKIFWLFFGRAITIPMHFELTFKIRGLLFFSGAILIVLLWQSRSVHLAVWSSPDLAPVSLRSCRNVAVFLPEPAISVSISFSVGMNGILYQVGEHPTEQSTDGERTFAERPAQR